MSRNKPVENKQAKKDEALRDQILATRIEHPNYGTDRLCIHLKRPKSVVHRVVNIYSMQLARKVKKPFKAEDQNFKDTKIPNLTKDLKVIAPNVVWASDFTYLKFGDRNYYLATYLDIYTREIIAWNLSDLHDTDFILETFKKACSKAGTTPIICHSDQGSEYRSQAYSEVLKSLDIKISMSPKASPWRNGFQESYYRGFKEDLGELKQISSFGELYEKVAHTIHYYNNSRIHSALKQTPKEFALQFFQRKNYKKHNCFIHDSKCQILLFQKVVS